MESRLFRDVVPMDDPVSHEDDDGRSCIAVIGIDRYRSWHRLNNAVNDARAALSLFMQLGFEQIHAPLFDEAATGNALRRLVTDDLGELSSNDSLVLFFAGHGHTGTQAYPDGVSVKKGYIIPVDGDAADGDRPSGRAGTWLRLDNWLSDVAHLPVRHLLVILDACHSGIALSSLIQWRGKEVVSAARYGQLRTRRSRRIITSALDNELAMDNGPAPGHSLFMGCLIEGLTGGLMAHTGDSLVTGTEIGRYVQRRVVDYPHSQQTPSFGALELDNQGELFVRLLAPVTWARTSETAVPPSTPSVTAASVSNDPVDSKSSPVLPSALLAPSLQQPVRW